MHFDFIDLRLLAAVLETGSITAGAERVGLSLAAASARMRGLEQQAGVALLTRNPRGVQATPAGERLLQHARVLLQQRDRLRVTWPSSRQASAASCASSPIPSPPTLSAGAAGGFSGAAPTHRHRAGGAAQPGHRAGDRRTGGGYRHRGGSRRSARADKLPFPAGSSGAGAAAGHALSGRRTVSFADTLSLSLSACRKKARCNSIWSSWRYAAAARCGYGRALISTPSAAWCGAAPGWRWCRKRAPNAIRRSDTAPCR